MSDSLYNPDRFELNHSKANLTNTENGDFVEVGDYIKVIMQNKNTIKGKILKINKSIITLQLEEYKYNNIGATVKECLILINNIYKIEEIDTHDVYDDDLQCEDLNFKLLYDISKQ